ncbi:hypothetical protein EC968_005371 [Mortierella alpina]|nr:hypothetical protein EC968_005371 [Mortierella alpina]
MRKRGSTKAASNDKKKKTTTAAADTATASAPGTAGKRQLPLDFSRHAVQTKKVAVENATKTSAGDPSPWSSSPLSASEPEVIRVNLVAYSRPGLGKNIDSVEQHVVENHFGERESVCSARRDLGVDFDSESHGEEKLKSDINNTDRSKDHEISTMAPERLAKTPIPGPSGTDFADNEDDLVLNVKKEDILGPDAILPIKSEPEGDDGNLDVLLPPRFRWKTVYVAAFELALDTVLPEEAFLFTDEEHTLFETYRALPDDPKHLFVRLFLRKQKFWFRTDRLENRYKEIEDLEAATQLLIAAGLLMDQSQLSDPEDALVMLTMDELKLLARRVGFKEKLAGKQRQVLTMNILEHYRQQSFLSKRLLLAPGGTPDGEGPGRRTGLTTHVFAGDTTKRNSALIQKIIEIAGPSVKIYPNIVKVFERLHLVFYRSREYSERPTLLEAILAKIGQRTFPTYEITRTNTVFRNRDELLKYEEAIRLHFELSKMIESAMGPGRESVIYVRDPDEGPAASKGNKARRSNSAKSTRSVGDDGSAAEEVETKSDAGDQDSDQARRRQEVIGIYEAVIEKAEWVRDAWRQYIATEAEVTKCSPNYFLLRFSPGWVYTQILRLELRAFAFLKRFEEESILLHELLDQYIYSLGQRGGWYERLALIKSNYAFHKRMGKQEALQVCMMALRDKHVHAVDATLIQARIVRLESELRLPFRDRHDFSYLTLRKAQQRILTGERLNTPGTAAPSYASSHSYSFVPNSMGSTHPVAQQRPLWRNIDGSDCGVEELALSYYGTLGYRGYHSENSILSTLFGLLFWDILFYPQPGVFETLYQTEPLDLRTDAFFIQRQDMIMERIENIAKSTIIDDFKEESVTERSASTSAPASSAVKKEEKGDDIDEDEPLTRRRSTRTAPDLKPVDRTLMESMLFEDEIRQETEGCDDSEERQAQRAREEYLTRKRRACFYLDLLGTHDDMYREKGVFCVGVNWTYTKEELLQIAECIGGNALAEICKVLAQEYSKRCSGMPDLCCWNYEKKLVKFVEVKGPGDRLSSKQQVWIDLLTSLQVDIELCIVQVSKAEDAFLEERAAFN